MFKDGFAFWIWYLDNEKSATRIWWAVATLWRWFGWFWGEQLHKSGNWETRRYQNKTTFSFDLFQKLTITIHMFQPSFCFAPLDPGVLLPIPHRCPATAGNRARLQHNHPDLGHQLVAPNWSMPLTNPQIVCFMIIINYIYVYIYIHIIMKKICKCLTEIIMNSIVADACDFWSNTLAKAPRFAWARLSRALVARVQAPSKTRSQARKAPSKFFAWMKTTQTVAQIVVGVVHENMIKIQSILSSFYVIFFLYGFWASEMKWKNLHVDATVQAMPIKNTQLQWGWAFNRLSGYLWRKSEQFTSGLICDLIQDPQKKKKNSQMIQLKVFSSTTMRFSDFFLCHETMSLIISICLLGTRSSQFQHAPWCSTALDSASKSLSLVWGRRNPTNQWMKPTIL